MQTSTRGPAILNVLLLVFGLFMIFSFLELLIADCFDLLLSLVFCFCPRVQTDCTRALNVKMQSGVMKVFKLRLNFF
jgi:hypothetical protein